MWTNRRSLRYLWASSFGAALAVFLPAAGALFSACSEAVTTTGERVVLATEIRLAPNAAEPFTNAFDFEITLDAVFLSVGELRYFAGAPIGRYEPSRFPDLLGPRQAFAHPGHYVAGDVLGEMLEPESIELLQGGSKLADGAGITGEYLSASFRFEAPPAGELGDELLDAVVRVRGSARGPEFELEFEVSATENDVLDTYGEPLVSGCPFSEGSVDQDGTVTLEVDPALWLDQVDFSREPEVNAEGRTILDSTGVPHEAFVRGLVKAAAYSFSYTPKSGDS